MKKILLLLSLLLILSATVFGFTYLKQQTQSPLENTTHTASGTENTESGSGQNLSDIQTLSREEIVRQKIERIKKRHALKGLIIE